MASKLKGQGGAKGFLLLHGEKIAISLVGLVALWLIYKTTSLPRLEDKYQAAKLQDEIRQTTAAVRDTQWPEPNSEQASEVRPAKPIDAKAENLVSTDAYKISPQGFDPIDLEPTLLRPDPKLLNAEGVRATGGSGLFAFIDENVRKQRELERAKQEAERLRREQQQAERDMKNQGRPETGPASRRNPRGPAAAEYGLDQPFDPDHPKRRPLENVSQLPGVPRQGDERIERAYWACVVAKVPIREQLKLYQDAFEKAKLGFDPARDFPQYKGYLVQRAEVIAGKPLEWKPVPVTDGEHKSLTAKPISVGAVAQATMESLYGLAQQFWAGMSPDVIDPRFSDYVLTFPLPPLVGRDWGADATHPDIPLLADTPPLEEDIAPLAATTTTPTPDHPAPGDYNAIFGATGTTGAVPGAMPGGYPSGPRPGGYGADGRGQVRI